MRGATLLPMSRRGDRARGGERSENAAPDVGAGRGHDPDRRRSPYADLYLTADASGHEESGPAYDIRSALLNLKRRPYA